MFGLPLHPLIVHFPIGLTVLMPVLAVLGVVLLRRGVALRRAWLAPVVGSALLAVSAWVTVETGQDQEERVEDIVPRAAMHEHEEAGETLMILSGVLFVITAAGLVQNKIGAAARAVTILGAVALVGAALKVGHTGGTLVYTYDAARAYSAPAGTLPASADREGDH